MNLNPKRRFQANRELASWHLEVVATDRFQASAEAALAQLACRLGGNEGDQLRLNGANLFLTELMSLSQAELPPTQKQHGLIHDTRMKSQTPEA